MQHHISKQELSELLRTRCLTSECQLKWDGTIAPKSLTGMAEKTINKQRTITMDPIRSRNRIVSCVLWKIQ